MKTVGCPICGKAVEVEDEYEVEYCCSGSMESQCGCGGFPVDPAFCNDCTEKLFGG